MKCWQPRDGNRQHDYQHAMTAVYLDWMWRPSPSWCRAFQPRIAAENTCDKTGHCSESAGSGGSTRCVAKVGGLDIAGMCGLFLGGAAQQMPVVMDGFISQVAALTAVRLVPECADYILASHVSEEPAQIFY